VIETSHTALPTNELQAVEVLSKSVGNKEHFILEPETVFRPQLASNSRGWLKTYTHPHSLQAGATFVEIGQ
jgi:hypothetical protein